jgi:hypothetical protein
MLMEAVMSNIVIRQRAIYFYASRLLVVVTCCL